MGQQVKLRARYRSKQKGFHTEAQSHQEEQFLFFVPLWLCVSIKFINLMILVYKISPKWNAYLARHGLNGLKMLF